MTQQQTSQIEHAPKSTPADFREQLGASVEADAELRAKREKMLPLDLAREQHKSYTALASALSDRSEGVVKVPWGQTVSDESSFKLWTISFGDETAERFVLCVPPVVTLTSATASIYSGDVTEIAEQFRAKHRSVEPLVLTIDTDVTPKGFGTQPLPAESLAELQQRIDNIETLDRLTALIGQEARGNASLGSVAMQS